MREEANTTCKKKRAKGKDTKAAGVDKATSSSQPVAQGQPQPSSSSLSPLKSTPALSEPKSKSPKTRKAPKSTTAVYKSTTATIEPISTTSKLIPNALEHAPPSPKSVPAPPVSSPAPSNSTGASSTKKGKVSDTSRHQSGRREASEPSSGCPSGKGEGKSKKLRTPTKDEELAEVSGDTDNDSDTTYYSAVCFKLFFPLVVHNF